MTRSRGIRPPRRFWTETEMQMLRLHYAHSRTEDLARVLKRSGGAVYEKANTMGLRKSAAFLASEASGRSRRQSPKAIASRFKPGHTTWNKGMKGLQYAGSQATQFKRGQRSHTWQPLGSYRICMGNLERKVNDLPGPNNVRWHPVHRIVWEAANGSVPAGCICVFKPGRHTQVLNEITLDRIEVITRAENAQRNHPRTRHPELGRLVQLKGAITRQVNRIAREAREQQS